MRCNSRHTREQWARRLPNNTECQGDSRNQIVLVLVLVLVLDGKRVPGAQRLSVGPVDMDKQVLSQLHWHQIFEHEHEHEHETILAEFLDVQAQLYRDRSGIAANASNASAPDASERFRSVTVP